jgi:hypothetical protein
MGWPSCRAHCGYSPPTLPLIKEYPLAKQERLKEISKARNTLPTVGWLRVNFFSAQRRKVAKIKTPWRLCSSAPLREIIFFVELRSLSINLPNPKEREGCRLDWLGQTVRRIA